MRFNVLNRKVHSWAAAFIALPILVIIGSGLLLQVKKQLTWVQPTEQTGTGTAPVIDFEGILASVRALPEHGVSVWKDVNRLDVRPSKGIVKMPCTTVGPSKRHEPGGQKKSENRSPNCSRF